MLNCSRISVFAFFSFFPKEFNKYWKFMKTSRHFACVSKKKKRIPHSILVLVKWMADQILNALCCVFPIFCWQSPNVIFSTLVSVLEPHQNPSSDDTDPFSIVRKKEKEIRKKKHSKMKAKEYILEIVGSLQIWCCFHCLWGTKAHTNEVFVLCLR